MEQFLEYIKPELLVLIPVLFFIGKAIKASQVKDTYIPFIIGGLGIALSTLYTIAICVVTDYQSIAMCVFTALVQGILVAGCSVYVDQVIKQSQKRG